MTSYNLRSPAVKRLMREAQELSQPTELYYAQPLEDNLFEWHFTIRGPEGSEFEGGIYHGQISLPTEYPMKPPNIMLLTPNGRFEQYRQICLSISGYHPETWCPSWSIRTALLAIIGFMPTSGAGAIGSMSVPVEERKKLAISSQTYSCDICGPTKHLLLPLTSASSSTAQEAKEVASQIFLTDPNASNENTLPLESQVSQTPEKPTPTFGMPQVISQSIPSHVVETAVNGSLRPAYWLCYPVYSVNRTETETDPTTSASRPTKKEPPLSFEQWLKTVHEHSVSSGISGNQSTHSAPQCLESSLRSSSPSYLKFSGKPEEVPGCVITAPAIADKKSSCLCTTSAKLLSPNLLDEIPGVVMANLGEGADEMASTGFVDEVPGVPLSCLNGNYRLSLTAQIPSAAKILPTTEEIPGVLLNLTESLVEPPKSSQLPLSPDNFQSSKPFPSADIDVRLASSREQVSDAKSASAISCALTKRKDCQKVGMPETASCPREVEHVDSTMGAPEVVVAKTNPLPEKEVSARKPKLNICTSPVSGHETDPEVPRVSACSQEEFEGNQLPPSRDDCSSSASHRQGSSSSPTTIVLDTGISELHGELTSSASLRCERPLPAENICQLPCGPTPQRASTSVTEDPQVIPLPSRSACKERAQRILQKAAERHRQQACNMMARFGDTERPGRSILGRLRLRSNSYIWWVVFAVAAALIALILRRIIIMSTTGPC